MFDRSDNAERIGDGSKSTDIGANSKLDTTRKDRLMRDDDEASLVNPESVIPMGPSVYSGPTGPSPEAGAAVDLIRAPAGPCVYYPAKSNRSRTTKG